MNVGSNVCSFAREDVLSKLVPNLDLQSESSNFIDIAFVFQLPIVILFLQIFQFNIANNFTTYKMNYINPEHMSMNKFLYIFYIYFFHLVGIKK